MLTTVIMLTRIVQRMRFMSLFGLERRFERAIEKEELEKTTLKCEKGRNAHKK